MLKLRACPKCKTGAIGLIVDWDGEYFQCLNCGYALDLRPVAAPVNHLGKHLGPEQPITGGEGAAA